MIYRHLLWKGGGVEQRQRGRGGAEEKRVGAGSRGGSSGQEVRRTQGARNTESGAVLLVSTAWLVTVNFLSTPRDGTC